MNQKAIIYRQQTQCKRIIPRPTRHTATLTQLYVNPHRRLPTSIYTNPMKEKRKGVATSLLRVVRLTTAFEPVPRTSRASRALTLVPQARPSRALLKHRLSCASQLGRLSSATLVSQNPFSLQALSSSRLLSPLFLAVFSHNSPKYSHKKNSLHSSPALSWTRSIRVRQSGEDTPPLPLPLLTSETGR